MPPEELTLTASGEKPDGTGLIARHMASKLLAQESGDGDKGEKKDEGKGSESEGDSDKKTDEEGAEDEETEEESDEGDGDEEDSEDEDEGEEEDSDDDEDEEDDSEDSDEEDEGEGTKRKKPFELKLADGRTRKTPPDAKIVLTVDGEEKEVALSEVADEFTGKFKVDRELTRAKQTQARAESLQSSNEKALGELKTINARLTSTFKELLDDNSDPFLALAEVAEIAGLDDGTKFVADFIRRTYRSFDHLLKNVLGNDQAEINFMNAVKLENIERKKKRNDEMSAAQRKREEFKQTRMAAIQRSGLSEEEFSRAERIILRAREEGRLEDFGIEKDEKGEYQISFTNTEDIAYEATAKKFVDDALKSHKERLPKDKYRALLERAVFDIRYLRTKKKGSDDDVRESLRDAVNELFSKDADSEDRRDAKRFSKKVGKKGQTSANGQARPKKKEGGEVLSFKNLRERLQA